ncbi:FAD-dependent thymidylate synthase [bacterium]|nr:FAD-dependent thymidylate synthase [bacterium]
MKVKVVAYTQPYELKFTAEDFISYVARVSNPHNQHNTLTSNKLLKYLVDHSHWSPFEMVNVCMEIETTRDIARQILRHRSFSFQEFSQRYAEVVNWDRGEARLQDNKNRQNSIPTQDRELQRWWDEQQVAMWKQSTEAYKLALQQGVAKEVARKVLPEGLAMSRMYMNGTLRSWLHYVDIRCDVSTQKEHREVAQQCKVVLSSLFPSLFED